MDNLFQVLIFLFIIYTIFGSAFRKKKTEQKKYPQQDQGEDLQQSSPRPKYETTDILENLFGMKLPKTGSEYPRFPETAGEEKYEANYPDLEKSLPDITSVKILDKKIQDIDYDKLASLESAQSLNVLADEKIHYGGKKDNKRLINLKKKMKSPSTLRDFYLISEILNKPKAFRK